MGIESNVRRLNWVGISASGKCIPSMVRMDSFLMELIINRSVIFDVCVFSESLLNIDHLTVSGNGQSPVAAKFTAA